jgi:hypothetical protein
MADLKIPNNYTIRIEVYDGDGKNLASGLDFVSVFEERKINMIFFLENDETENKLVDLDFNFLSEDSILVVDLITDKEELIGQAKMGKDFIVARKKYYNECAIEFNVNEIWRQYQSSKA